MGEAQGGGSRVSVRPTPFLRERSNALGGHLTCLVGRFWRRIQNGWQRRAGLAVRARVGGRLVGRFCGRPAAPPTGRAERNTGGLQISPGGLPADPGFLLDTPQRPSKPPQRDDLLSFFFAQDIAHDEEGNRPRSPCPDSVSLAGFQPSLIGRFWVSPKDPRHASVQRLAKRFVEGLFDAIPGVSRCHLCCRASRGTGNDDSREENGAGRERSAKGIGPGEPISPSDSP